MMTNDDIRELVDSSNLVGDAPATRDRFEHDGYIFFRDVLDPELTARAYATFKEPLVEEGLLEPGAPDTRWTGQPARTRRPVDAIGKAVWPDITRQSRLNALVADVMGEQPVWLPIVSHRSSLPGSPFPASEGIFAGRHQDGFFNEGSPFVICWIPVMDVSRKNGGLAISAGSHKGGYLHDPAMAPRYPIPADAIADDTWVTTDFKAGDVLMFDHRTAHTGLPNNTDQIRLSIDMRVTPASAPQPLIGIVTRQSGPTFTLRTDEGQDHDITVTPDTYIRHMNPFPKVPLAELAQVAGVGANVIAMIEKDGRATMVRTNFYD